MTRHVENINGVDTSYTTNVMRVTESRVILAADILLLKLYLCSLLAHIIAIIE